MSPHAAEFIAFAGGCGLTAAFFVGWIRDLRRDRDFWHRLYVGASEDRAALVETATSATRTMQSATDLIEDLNGGSQP